MLTQEEIKQLAANDFSRDCKEIVFTQCASTTPVIWTGPGTLSMSTSGQLQVKVFLSNEVDCFGTFVSRLEGAEPAGTLLSDERYFDMEATDYSGRKWQAKRFLVDENLFSQTGGGTVRATLRKVSMRESRSVGFGKDHQMMAFRARPDIPFTRMVQHADGSHTRTALDITLRDGTALELIARNGLIYFNFKHTSQPLHPGVAKLVKEAVSIASGCRLMSMYQTRIGADGSEHTIWSAHAPIDHEESDLWSLFHPRMPESFCAFVVEYVAFKEQVPNGFFDYWMKVYDAWQIGAFLAALPLSVYIEGVISEFFPEGRTEPTDFKADVDKVIALIQQAPVPDDVIRRCAGALARIKEKSTTRALKVLAKEGWFSSALVKAWGDIRHKSAHGHDITTSDADQQKLLDNTLKCLHLFYLLLLIRMRFTQEFRDLSTHEFPKTRLVFPSP